jgi:hypothetical protein
VVRPVAPALRYRLLQRVSEAARQPLCPRRRGEPGAEEHLSRLHLIDMLGSTTRSRSRKEAKVKRPKQSTLEHINPSRCIACCSGAALSSVMSCGDPPRAVLVSDGGGPGAREVWLMDGPRAGRRPGPRTFSLLNAPPVAR